ncbi:MAG: 4Fe-4S ferredoxin [Endomicrobia bacterium]|nr:4Fe-4S ferredoxin [Endomicrobiia bacterium]MDW8056610.1 4Fe-4S ferredoxin [Elusimicrobiota bacterium]
MLKINNKKCNSCEECIFVCINNSISIVNGEFVIDINKCKNCKACRNVCSAEAIEEIFIISNIEKIS